MFKVVAWKVDYKIGQCKTQTADCRLRTRGKMQTECKMQTALHIRQKFQWTPKQLKSAYPDLQYFKKVNQISCRTSFSFTPFFYRHNSSCTVFWVSSFHLSVNIVVLHQFTVPGHVYRKLRIKSWSVKWSEVSRTEKRFKIAIMFSGRWWCSREERSGFVKADVLK